MEKKWMPYEISIWAKYAVQDCYFQIHLEPAE